LINTKKEVALAENKKLNISLKGECLFRKSRLPNIHKIREIGKSNIFIDKCKINKDSDLMLISYHLKGFLLAFYCYHQTSKCYFKKLIIFSL